jgi:tape measure domain-containing protein
MADTSLGRASLSVTADLSGFTSSLDTASTKVQSFGNSSIAAAMDANKVTTATEKVTLSLDQLQQAAASSSINATMFKQTSAAAKLAVDQMVLLDGATLLLMKDENELQFQTAKLQTGYKELENNLMKTDAAFKNNTLLIELNTQKQKLLALENKNVIASMMAVDDQAIGYAASTKTLNAELDINARKLDLQAKQMNLDSGATKALHDELVKLEEQEKALALAEDKVKGINQPVPIIEPPAVVEPPKIDTNTPEFVQEQINLKSKTDLASKALELQARQMNVDSGATKKLHDEMVRLEQQEQKLIAAENKARGIPPPLPIKPPPIPENKNTAAYVTNAKKMSAETDILNKKLDMQSRQMMIADGSAAKLAKELSALEKAEKKLADAEIKLGIRKPPEEKKSKESKGGMKITDMLGIGFFTSAFSKIFDGALNLVTKITSSVIDLGAKVIESGSKFQELDNRLKALTGFKGIAKGLQDIMKTGPSASFNALGEAATRLSQMKFRPDVVTGLIKDFNRLGVALGNPEKIVALITDKLADMASEGVATMSALGKLEEEGIPIFQSMASRMGISVDELKRRVAAGLISVTDAAVGLQDAANMPNMTAAAQESANSFSGVWSRVTNNIEVLMQKLGTSLLEGFGLVNLGDTVTNFFDSVFKKAEDLEPLLQKIGAFVSTTTGMVMDNLAGVIDEWVIFTEKMTIDEMLQSVKNAASQMLEDLKPMIDALSTIIGFTVDFIKVGGTVLKKGNTWAQAIQDNILNPISDAGAATVNWGLGLTDAANGITTIGNNTIAATDAANNLANAFDLAAQNAQNLADTDMSGAGGGFGPDDINEMMQPASNGGGTWLTALEEEMQLAEMELAEFDKQWQKLSDEVQKPMRIEEPGWKKFFADNITPLQQYENEVAKLKGMLNEGPEGVRAFALGSANAIAKLKQATGLGGPQQFASAVQAGSAAEFQVKVDEMGKGKNVQEEIRQLMEAAAEVEAQQLEAAREIAEAIKNLPAAMPRPQQIAVALNP